jgi:hypothetical protein
MELEELPTSGVVRLDMDRLTLGVFLDMEGRMAEQQPAASAESAAAVEAAQIQRKLVFDAMSDSIARLARSSAVAQLSASGATPGESDSMASSCAVSARALRGLVERLEKQQEQVVPVPAGELRWTNKAAEQAAVSALDHCRAASDLGLQPEEAAAASERALRWVCFDVGDEVVEEATEDAADALMQVLQERQQARSLEPYTWTL